jgi:Ca2+-binding EF-hand superfamily protein
MNGIRVLFCFSLIFFLCLTLEARSADRTDRKKILKEYEAADLNKDGYVDENEYKRFISKKFNSVHGNGEQRTEKNESRKRGGEEFVATEKDKEAKIKFKEFLNGRLRFFNEADANKDRLLSLEEYTRMKMMDPVK